MNNDIVRQGDTVYIYNTKTGIWSNTETSILTAIHNLGSDLIFRQKETNGKIIMYNYGGKVNNINNILKLLVAQLPQSNFIENNCFKNKECLLFKNGWFDMGTMKFHIGFDGCREKVFTHRILRNFTEKRDINLERHIKKTLFENPYNNKKIGFDIDIMTYNDFLNHLKDFKILYYHLFENYFFKIKEKYKEAGFDIDNDQINIDVLNLHLIHLRNLYFDKLELNLMSNYAFMAPIDDPCYRQSILTELN
jgi:hypothetical protein